MILGCIADDFTGAADLAGTLAAEGMATTLLTSIDDVATAEGDAGVVALKTRSIAAADAVAQSLAALERLMSAGCRQFFFKYCSTFDSTPQGNIGPVAEALAARLDARGVVVCPAFPANGRTLYQGHLFVGDVLLAESGMRHHPLTPMTDSDIRRWLARQTRGDVSHVPLATVRRGPDEARRAIAAAAGLVVVDAIADDDLRTIGCAVANARLVTGGSALAMGLPDNFRREGLIGSRTLARPGARGPAIVLSGSCSAATNAQVAWYRSRHPSMAVDVDALLGGAPVLEAANAFLAQHAHEAPLVYSTAPPEVSGRFIGADGRNRAAEAVERLLAVLAVRAVARGVTRIVVAGGETSGAVVEALRPGPLAVGAEIAPGVPALGRPGLALALKSGNFGDERFFASAAAALEED